jgi:signal peptidase II
VDRVASNPVTDGPATEPDSGNPTAASGAAPAAPRQRRLGVFALCAVAVLALDLGTKQLVVAHLSDGEPQRVIPGVLWLTLTRNGGAAFSMGETVTWVFPTIAIAVVAVIVYLVRTLRSVPWAIALGLVLGGAVGNLLDRLFRAPGPFRGHVVDFISMFSPTGSGFAIFNLADSALVCGVILAVLLELTGRHRDGSRVRH